MKRPRCERGAKRALAPDEGGEDCGLDAERCGFGIAGWKLHSAIRGVLTVQAATRYPVHSIAFARSRFHPVTAGQAQLPQD